MVEGQYTRKFHLMSPWFPYLVAIIITGIFTSLCYIFYKKITPPYVIANVTEALPWIILVFGISLAILSGLAMRFMQLTRERKKLYEIISEEFKKEIVERNHSEETKQRLEKALLQGQKLQAIGTLAGGIAHDFNNLLYAIIGYVEMARDDVAIDTITHKNLGRVLDAAKRGQELIARILTFSRRQHHEFKALCLKDTIEGVLGLLRPTIPSSATVNFTSSPEEIMISGNQTQLHQVLVNIINNAVDAVEGEGTIEIHLNRISSRDPLLLEIPDIKADHYCKIDISDKGHGMDQATMARIFEPFYTTKEVGRGTGLGLSTVHSIMKEHGGEVLVKSQLGFGTTFTLLLPEQLEEKMNG